MHLLHIVNFPLLVGLPGNLSVYQCIYFIHECSSVRLTMFQVTSAYTNASTLYSESSSVRLTMCSRLLSAYTNASTLYSESSSVRWTMFQVYFTSAYTNASTLYTEGSSVRWTMFQVTSSYIPRHLLYTVNVPLLG